MVKTHKVKVLSPTAIAAVIGTVVAARLFLLRRGPLGLVSPPATAAAAARPPSLRMLLQPLLRLRRYC